jgi:cold shock CspA family protein
MTARPTTMATMMMNGDERVTNGRGEAYPPTTEPTLPSSDHTSVYPLWSQQDIKVIKSINGQRQHDSVVVKEEEEKKEKKEELKEEKEKVKINIEKIEEKDASPKVVSTRSYMTNGQPSTTLMGPIVSTKRQTGQVKFFDKERGFGFIIPDEDCTVDVFVHHTAIRNNGGFKSLKDYEIVEYDLVQGPKGMQAANVTGPGGVPIRGMSSSTARPLIPTVGGFNGQVGGFGYQPVMTQGGFVAYIPTFSIAGGMPLMNMPYRQNIPTAFISSNSSPDSSSFSSTTEANDTVTLHGETNRNTAGSVTSPDMFVPGSSMVFTPQEWLMAQQQAYQMAMAAAATASASQQADIFQSIYAQYIQSYSMMSMVSPFFSTPSSAPMVFNPSPTEERRDLSMNEEATIFVNMPSSDQPEIITDDTSLGLKTEPQSFTTRH